MTGQNITPRRRSSGFTLIELMIVIAIISVLAAILVPNFLRAKAQARYTACKSNLKLIATAYEMYGIDNSGRYPTFITTWVPTYLKVVPKCPSSGNDYARSVLTSPDVFTINCRGTGHIDVGEDTDFPQFSSGVGLIEE